MFIIIYIFLYVIPPPSDSVHNYKYILLNLLYFCHMLTTRVSHVTTFLSQRSGFESHQIQIFLEKIGLWDSNKNEYGSLKLDHHTIILI